MESIILDLGIMLLILICFIFTQIYLRDINVKTNQNMNGISHVWGVITELKLDIQLLEDKLVNSKTAEIDEGMEE
tara:strand:+ start:740 stop:964 length:225 start_codon:yes stop_codon:yes gene_type:complete